MEKELLKILSDLGFPILVSIIFGFGVFIAFKFILMDVIDAVKKIHNIIFMLESKMKSISNDIAVLDILISTALNVKPDFVKLTTKLEKNNNDR